jgi:hypothetical protein
MTSDVVVEAPRMLDIDSLGTLVANACPCARSERILLTFAPIRCISIEFESYSWHVVGYAHLLLVVDAVKMPAIEEGTNFKEFDQSS